jgi:hypothetical protein
MTMSRSTVTRVVLLSVATVVAAGAHLPALGAAPGTYVAVRDSFTAGPGALNQQLDQLGCFRSDHNYPHLVAQARGSALRDPSCSGAKTADLTAPQVILGGANPPAVAAGPDLRPRLPGDPA